MDAQPPHNKNDPVESFIARWQGREGGQERANYVSFLKEMCAALELPQPDPADASHERNDYVFERAVTRHRDDGDRSGRIDLYRKGSFVLEAKQSRWKGGSKEIKSQDDLFAAGDEPQDRGKRGAARAWDVLMLNAKRQAEEYARALPPSHGWPPFILVCDVGHCIEVYADFTGQGKNYTQFPDRQSFRIYLEDLRKPDVRETLTRIWQEPQALDPTKTAAKVTREIAERLAAVSKSLEAKKHDAEEVAHFLMRCLFTMFAEDVRLLPENCFSELLDECRNKPDSFVPLLTDLWKSMNEGIYAPSIRAKVLQFNGNLFANAKVIKLDREEIGELYEAAQKDWREVEPAIFGTLLEQALDPNERRRLGAHYTPRAYVERLVVATIIEPLREDWRNVQAAAETKRSAGDKNGAADEVKTFHDKLCKTRVLDPACGTGNFLYVSLELMKRLEGEVLEALLDLGGQEALRGLGAHTVDPHQFLGLEINPRAAAIAELVLWIGFLQWHFRTKGGIPSEPILHKFRNIEVKNAVLAWDGHPLPQIVDGNETYPNPKRPIWPEAEFIVGNPPFIGNKRMREHLGSAFVDALRLAWSTIPESSDFVMYWWQYSAELVALSKARRFGLVTTNSITMTFNRIIVERALAWTKPISIIFAIPDHPWSEGNESADVRIAMTVGSSGHMTGAVQCVIGLRKGDPGYDQLQPPAFGHITSLLRVGARLTDAKALIANSHLSFMGVIPVCLDFVVTQSTANLIGVAQSPTGPLRKYLGGKDLTDNRPVRLILDFFGYSADDVRLSYPRAYQHLLETVKPFRDKVNRKNHRERWWIFGESRPGMRAALSELTRYIATTETSKHRWFTFLDTDILPDQKIRVVATSDAVILAAMSSKPHVLWATAIGGRVGKGNDPVYNNTTCFDPFPFPTASALQQSELRSTGEELDAFRKNRQKEHAHLTLTQMYNVLEKLKANAELDDEDERIKKEGLILILKELHERIDALVFEAYGWPATLTDDQILENLVALNHERAAEEKRGHVRWLRPDYQIPRFGKGLDKMAAKEEGAQVVADLGLAAPAARKASFPTDAVSQTAAVFAALAASSGAVTVKDIAAGFRGSKNLEKYIGEVLASLTRLGHVTSRDGKTYAIRRAA